MRLRDNVVVLLPPEPVEPPELAPLVTELYTLQVWVYPPAMVAVMVAVPVLPAGLTLPFHPQ